MNDAAPTSLGRFLRVLHREAPAAAPHNPFRRVALAVRTEATLAGLANLAGLRFSSNGTPPEVRRPAVYLNV
ncbi:MAG: hypothetical protein AAGA56_15340 [Myxococcota bacterium]